jgi:hypothetical protein
MNIKDLWKDVHDPKLKIQTGWYRKGKITMSIISIGRHTTTLKEFWKDINQPTEQIRTAWFRKGIVICTSPIAITVLLICSLLMILWGDFNILDTVWKDFKIIVKDCWKGPTT